MSAGKKSRYPWKRTLLGALLLFGAITAWRWTAPFVPRIAPLKALSWKPKPGERILARAEAMPDDGLLITVLKSEEKMDWNGKAEAEHLADIVKNPRIYRYQPGADRLVPATLEDWERSDRGICDSRLCSPNTAGATGTKVPFATKNRVLHISDRVVRTCGRTVLRTRLSPEGDMVAVLSTTGRYRKGTGFLFFGQPGGAWGPRFLEVFRGSSGERVGGPLKLQRAAVGGPGTDMFWSADQRFLICEEDWYEKLWIILIDAGELPAEEEEVVE